MNSTKAFSIISKNVIKGVGTIRGAHLNPHEIKKVIARVMGANPSEDKLVAYAYRAGRNAALDQIRHEEALARMAREEAQRASRELSVAKERWDAQRDLEAARAQFDAFVSTLPASDRDLTRELKIKIVRMVVLEEREDSELCDVFPGSTPPQRWQWKRRGVKLILGHNPPAELARVLRRSVYKI